MRSIRGVFAHARLELHASKQTEQTTQVTQTQLHTGSRGRVRSYETNHVRNKVGVLACVVSFIFELSGVCLCVCVLMLLKTKRTIANSNRGIQCLWLCTSVSVFVCRFLCVFVWWPVHSLIIRRCPCLRSILNSSHLCSLPEPPTPTPPNRPPTPPTHRSFCG